MITRENAKELLPIIKAYSEGKKIQFFNGIEWIDKEIIYFDSEPHRYRIKPEPKYRPFKDIEECWEEMQKHQPFGWLMSIKDRHYTNVNVLTNKTDFDYLFNIYIFSDGTPFGIKK